ncbi:MAG: PAS domain-containing protein, partial [Defluviitaleaceae bacterium]|nr:PAS domain-containing protein [Defluviitaleaceae bacterium]
MDFLGHRLDAAIVQIWQNETRDGALHYVLRHEWRSDLACESPPVPIGTALPYSTAWKELFLRGDCINGPISTLSREDQDLLLPLGLKSTITIPLFSEGAFWGVYCVDDCHRERTFTNDEVTILRSAGLMLISAVNRNAQVEKLREVHERERLLLDSAPIAANLWNSDLELFACNEALVGLFGVKDKQEYIDRFHELSPEFQPDGQRSRDKAVALLKQALAGERLTLEWMHQHLDGEPVPVELTLTRVQHEGSHAVAVYLRDLRERLRVFMTLAVMKTPLD